MTDLLIEFLFNLFQTDLILPQLRHLTGKTDKTEKNKMFPPLSFRKKSSSSSQTQNEYSFENEIEMDP